LYHIFSGIAVTVGGEYGVKLVATVAVVTTVTVTGVGATTGGGRRDMVTVTTASDAGVLFFASSGQDIESRKGSKVRLVEDPMLKT
jgi:hypothetical protein